MAKVKEVKEVKNEEQNNGETVLGLVPGRAYLIRTLTHYYLGFLEHTTPTELVLSKGSWVPSTGRYHQFLLGKFDADVEIEPVPGELILQRGICVDFVPWTNPLPREAR